MCDHVTQRWETGSLVLVKMEGGVGEEDDRALVRLFRIQLQFGTLSAHVLNDKQRRAVAI